MNCVCCSGGLFATRGLLVLAGLPWANHLALRWLSYVFDTCLLTAALMLVTILHQYPFVQAWLTVKVLLLVVYVVLGSYALRRARSRRARLAAFVSALFVFLFIVSVAYWHDPLGVLRPLHNRPTGVYDRISDPSFPPRRSGSLRMSAKVQ